MEPLLTDIIPVGNITVEAQSSFTGISTQPDFISSTVDKSNKSLKECPHCNKTFK